MRSSRVMKREVLDGEERWGGQTKQQRANCWAAAGTALGGAPAPCSGEGRAREWGLLGEILGRGADR